MGDDAIAPVALSDHEPDVYVGRWLVDCTVGSSGASIVGLSVAWLDDKEDSSVGALSLIDFSTGSAGLPRCNLVGCFAGRNIVYIRWSACTLY